MSPREKGRAKERVCSVSEKVNRRDRESERERESERAREREESERERGGGMEEE